MFPRMHGFILLKIPNLVILNLYIGLLAMETEQRGKISFILCLMAKSPQYLTNGKEADLYLLNTCYVPTIILGFLYLSFH